MMAFSGMPSMASFATGSSFCPNLPLLPTTTAFALGIKRKFLSLTLVAVSRLVLKHHSQKALPPIHSPSDYAPSIPHQPKPSETCSKKKGKNDLRPPRIKHKHMECFNMDVKNAIDTRKEVNWPCSKNQAWMTHGHKKKTDVHKSVLNQKHHQKTQLEPEHRLLDCTCHCTCPSQCAVKPLWKARSYAQ